MNKIFITKKIKAIKYLNFYNNSKIIFNNFNDNENYCLNFDKNCSEFLYISNNTIFLTNSNFLFKLKNLIFNFFVGLNRGFIIILDILGLGFSVSSSKGFLRLNIGFNHSIFYRIPKNIIIRVKRKKIYLFSQSFFILKSLSVELQNFRKLSAYKLKGIKDKNDLYVKKN